MNTHIKDKKKSYLNYKKSFTKQDLLFIKKYPRLFIICSNNNVSKKQIDIVFHKMNQFNLISNAEIECIIHVILISEDEQYTFKKGSKGDYFKNVFKRLNIKILRRK